MRRFLQPDLRRAKGPTGSRFRRNNVSPGLVIHMGVLPRIPRHRRVRSMQRQMGFPYRFFAVTFAWSWTIWAPLLPAVRNVLPGGREFLSNATFPAVMLAAFGPAVGALFSVGTLEGKQALGRYIRGFFDVRLGWKMWLAPVATVGAITGAAWLLPDLWGAAHLPARTFLLASPVRLAAIALLAGSQEELGWRGYMCPALEERLGPWCGNLVLGAVWAIWHLPLFLIPDSGLAPIPLPAFFLFTAGLSWLFAAFRQGAGGRGFVAYYGHTCVNFFGSLLPAMASGPPQVRYWMWAGLALASGLVATALRSDTRRSAAMAKPTDTPTVRRVSA